MNLDQFYQLRDLILKYKGVTDRDNREVLLFDQFQLGLDGEWMKGQEVTLPPKLESRLKPIPPPA